MAIESLSLPEIRALAEYEDYKLRKMGFTEKELIVFKSVRSTENRKTHGLYNGMVVGYIGNDSQ